MKRIVILLPVLLALQVGVQPALAWTWPVDGPVLQPFSIGEDPYEAGQHRGIDVAGPLGAPVRAPAAGTVSFAGTVPGGGRTVTIRTADGYSVTLLHLGGVEAVSSGTVAEGDRVGTVGWSGEAEHDEPYVHLGIRLTADPNGYVDPLGLLPRRTQPAPEPTTEPAAQPASHPKPASERGGARSETPQPTRVKAERAPNESASPRRSREEPARQRDARSAERRVAPSAVPAPARPPLPAGTALRSLERESPLGRAPRDAAAGRSWLSLWAPVALAAAAAAAAGALNRRRKLGDARPADRATAMHLELAASSAEDAGSLRLRQEDRLVLHGDLERILLPETESLPDLDRDDDAPELVEVPDDSRGRAPYGRTCRSRRLSRPHRPRARPFSAGAQA